MKTDELVTVIIPVYNRSGPLKRAISSVLKQTHENIEILVVDDASNSDLYNLAVKPFKKNVGKNKIKYIRLPIQKGAQYARIIGIKNANGKYIAFLDSDDELTQDSIELRLQIFKNNPDAGLVYGDLFYGNTNKLVKFKELNGYSYKYLLKELSLCPYTTMMVRKQVFEICGYPDDNFPSWQDDDLVLTIGKYFSVFHCGFPVAIIYGARNSITKDKKMLYIGCKKMVSKYKGEIFKHHGRSRIYLWYLRIIRSYIFSLQSEVKEKIKRRAILTFIIYKSYLIVLKIIIFFLDKALKVFFDNIFA